MCFVPLVFKPSPVLPAAVAGNVQLYNKTIILSDCNPRQTEHKNKEPKPLCKQEEKESSVFLGLPFRAVLFGECWSIKIVYPLKYPFHFPYLSEINQNVKRTILDQTNLDKEKHILLFWILGNCKIQTYY